MSVTKQKMKCIILLFYFKYKGDYVKIFKAFELKEYPTEEEFNTYLKDVNINDYITVMDDDYLEELKYISYPPFAYHKDSINYINYLLETKREVEDTDRLNIVLELPNNNIPAYDENALEHLIRLIKFMIKLKKESEE